MINLLEDFKCMPNILGECKAWGDPHVVTFDGASNDVYGIGNYTFIELNYTGKEILNLCRFHLDQFSISFMIFSKSD